MIQGRYLTILLAVRAWFRIANYPFSSNEGATYFFPFLISMPKLAPNFVMFCKSDNGLEFDMTDNASTWLLQPIELQEDNSASSEATKRLYDSP